MELVEVEVVDGLQRFRRRALLKAFGQGLEPGAIFGLGGEQNGDSVVPAPDPAAARAARWRAWRSALVIGLSPRGVWGIGPLQSVT